VLRFSRRSIGIARASSGRGDGIFYQEGHPIVTPSGGRRPIIRVKATRFYRATLRALISLPTPEK